MRTTLADVWAEADNDLPNRGTILGFRSSGEPIYSLGGAAAAVIDDWIPIEYDSNVVQRVRMDSAIERYGQRYVMRSKTRSIPRSAGITVASGSTYSDDTSTNDEVTITARRFHSRFKVDEDDLADANSRMDVLSTKGEDWAISYADTFDNACLGATGAENGTTIPFTSAYRTLRSNDSDASYVADANYLTWDGTPSGLYGKLSGVFKLVETGKYWSLADSLVIAHPGWRDALRMTVDDQGRPIFIATTDGTPDTLFNVPIAWSRGCRASTVMSGDPTGRDLLYFTNRRFLARGDRSGPESLFQNARPQDDTDDAAIKFRARRAFKLTHPKAAAVLERVG
ncbi:phage major capsid family protein [Rhizomonospora bruguierae]|uniref:phage major capsid family protein n=1 Tax=Rhizomonospora bruguierae TaxID=1581705 RepID=UPI001BCF617A|nr:phage major capsid protein [Micromonospora sp. NBRC 107566]